MFGLVIFVQTIFTANHAKYSNGISFAWFVWFAIIIPVLNNLHRTFRQGIEKCELNPRQMLSIVTV